MNRIRGFQWWQKALNGALFLAVISTGPLGIAGLNEGPERVSKITAGESQLLTVSGRIVMPDGSPAAGAIVQSIAGFDDRTSTRADDAGKFQLQGVFANGVRLHASSADEGFQTTRFISSVAARKTCAAQLELTVSPAATHEVVVLAEERPVAGAHVVALGNNSFKVHGISGPDGKVKLRFPANDRPHEFVAWHPQLGVNSASNLDDRPLQHASQISLLLPHSHTIRAVDLDGRAVGNLEFGVIVSTEESSRIVTSEVEPAKLRTDANGIAIVPWMPRERLKSVFAAFMGGDWTVEDQDWEQTAKGVTTFTVRRLTAVDGRVVLPAGVNAAGLLVAGSGFGRKVSQNLYVRTDQNGRFRLRVPSDFACGLAVADAEWSSDFWSGMILETDTSKPAEIVIEAHRATPVTVRVTRGAGHKPVIDTSVSWSCHRTFGWIDGSGEPHNAGATVHAWMRTDAVGEAKVGVGLGQHEFLISSGQWLEQHSIDVTSNDPVGVEFHREWSGDRRVTGRLLVDGTTYKPSSQLTVQAWADRSAFAPLIAVPRVRREGTFEVVFDAESLSLIVIDPDREMSGSTRIDPGDMSVDLAMQPTATYSGRLVDETAEPMADRKLQFFVANSPYDAVATATTDKAGRFRFSGLPADVLLQLKCGSENDVPEYYIDDDERLFRSAEFREVAAVTLRRFESTATTNEPPKTLAARVARLCRNARLNGMRGLVVLHGDATVHVARMAGHALNEASVTDVLGYLPLQIKAAQREAESAVLADYGWPQPAHGEILLVVLGGDEKTIATRRITVADAADAGPRSGEFLKQHRLPQRDALVLLADAEEKARASGRRIWIHESGPRCGPCFQLARWMDDHRETLEKDYVVVKLMPQVDLNGIEVIKKLRKEEGGIPWFAITEPGGKILATSDGPLGNIGLPSSVVSLRHFRKMLEETIQRITREEVDALITSLSSRT